MLISGRRKSLRIHSRRCWLGSDGGGVTASLDSSSPGQAPPLGSVDSVGSLPCPSIVSGVSRTTSVSPQLPSSPQLDVAIPTSSRDNPVSCCEHPAQSPYSPRDVSSAEAMLIHEPCELDCSELRTKFEHFTASSLVSASNRDLGKEFCGSFADSSHSKMAVMSVARNWYVNCYAERKEPCYASSLSSVLVQLLTSSQGSDVRGLLDTALLTAVDGLHHDNEVSANRLLECISRLSDTADAYLQALHPTPAVVGSRRVRFACLSPPKDGDITSWRKIARTAQVMRSLLMLCSDLVSFRGVAERLMMCAASNEYRSRLAQGLGPSTSVQMIDILQLFLGILCEISREDQLSACPLSITSFRQTLTATLDSLTRALLRRMFDEPPIPRKDLRLTVTKRPSLCNVVVLTESHNKSRKCPLRNDFPVVDAMTPSALFSQALKQLWDLYHLYSDTIWLDEDSYPAMSEALQGNLENTITNGSLSDRISAAKVIIGACRARKFINNALQATYQIEEHSSLMPNVVDFREQDWSLLDATEVWRCIENLCGEIER